MRVRNHGKYTRGAISSRNPRAIARCDYSGMIVAYSSLRRQMEYRGKGLVWTGYLVAQRFLDKPNPQNLVPPIKLDPVPLPNSRPDNIVDAQTTLATSVGVLNLPVGGSSNITMTETQFDNGAFNFLGELTGNIVVYIPNNYNQFYANNLTTGAFTLSMQVAGSALPALLIPAANPVTLQGPQLVNTLMRLQFVNTL